MNTTVALDSLVARGNHLLDLHADDRSTHHYCVVWKPEGLGSRWGPNRQRWGAIENLL